jgi:hypothetical protein
MLDSAALARNDNDPEVGPDVVTAIRDLSARELSPLCRRSMTKVITPKR